MTHTHTHTHTEGERERELKHHHQQQQISSTRQTSYKWFKSIIITTHKAQKPNRGISKTANGDVIPCNVHKEEDRSKNRTAILLAASCCCFSSSFSFFLLPDSRDIMAVIASSAAAMLRFNFSSLVRLHLCLIASAILLIAQQSNAKTLNVGGALGWTDFDTAIAAAPNYEKWSSTNSINVGDVLVFSFPAGFQNVYLMPTKSAHDICDFSEATELDAGNAGTYAWRATKEGTYYFSSNKLVEGLGTHCQAGQKLAIMVTAAKVATTTMSSSTKELKPESYFGQRFTRTMIESLATAPAVAPVSPPAPVPVGAPVPVVAPPVVAPVAAPVLSPTPTPSTSPPLASPPAPPTGPAPAPASPPGHNAGAKVSTQARAGIFTATLALVALCF